MAYEKCPNCGSNKHQLMACSTCGFSRRTEAEPHAEGTRPRSSANLGAKQPRAVAGLPEEKQRLLKRPQSASLAREVRLEIDREYLDAIRSSLKGLNAFEIRARLIEFKKQGRLQIEKATEDFESIVDTLRPIISAKILGKIVELENRGRLSEGVLYVLQELQQKVLREKIRMRDERLQDHILARGGFQDGAKVPGSNLRKIDRNRTRK